MLSPQAWNAFLKTLEEPPPRTIFVLATTEAQKVLPTVVDRCHRFDFGRPSVEQVATVLEPRRRQEGIDVEKGALALIARHATGSFRDALGTLEQLVTYAGGRDDRARRRARGARGRRRRAAVRGGRGDHRPRSGAGAAGGGQARRVGPRPRPGAARPRGPRRASCSRSRCSARSRPSCGSPPSATAASPSRPARCPRPTRSGCSTSSRRRSTRPPTAPRPGSSSSSCWSRRRRPSSTRRRGAAGADRAARERARRPGRRAPCRAGGRAAPTRVRRASRRRAPAPGRDRRVRSRSAARRWTARSSSTTRPPPGPRWSTSCASENAMLAALLADARPVAVGERELTLAFPRRRVPQAQGRAGRPSAGRRRGAEGRHRPALALRYELRDDEEEPEGEPVLSGEELVRRFMEEFDAEEILEDDPERRRGQG